MTHPDNEYAQLLAETGMAGMLLVIAGVAVIILEFVRSRQQLSQVPHYIPAVAGAMTVAGIHSAFDFAPHVPLYSITLCSILGMAIAPATPGNSTMVSKHRARSFLDCILSSIGMICCLFMLFQSNSIQYLDSGHYLSQSDSRIAAKALTWAPTNWQAWYNLGRSLCIDDQSPETLAIAERLITQATLYDPNNYKLWNALGDFRMNLGLTRAAQQAFDRVKELRSWHLIPNLDLQE